MNSKKMNYFIIFGSVMKNTLKNTFKYVMKNKLQNNLLMFYFFEVYLNNEEQILQIKKLNENEIEKNI